MDAFENEEVRVDAVLVLTMSTRYGEAGIRYGQAVENG